MLRQPGGGSVVQQSVEWLLSGVWPIAALAIGWRYLRPTRPAEFQYELGAVCVAAKESSYIKE